MGMLLHNTLMEQEAAMRKALAEKSAEIPKEEQNEEPESEPVKKTGSRRKKN